LEDLVEAFGSACSFTRPEPGTTIALTPGDLAALALDDLGGGAQILDAAIGAGADEDAVELDVGDLLPGVRPI
jgi:hypothetical protein